MTLDRIAIALRRRTPWQAADLGFALARQWWLTLWLAWVIPTLLLLLLMSLLLPQDWLWLATLPAWWLKPVWDSMALYLASRRLFGEEVGLLETWRTVPRLLARELPAWLLWRRLSPTRSADLPVTVLERVRGAERRRRIRVLHAGMGSAAGWLTVVCVHFEWILLAGAIGLVALMLPEQVEFEPLAFFTEPSGYEVHLHNLAIALTASLVAPAYTMAGFMLYICRRVELEGWDIEIRFRDLAQRGSSEGRKMTAAAGILLCALLLGLPAEPSFAQSAPAADAPRTQEAGGGSPPQAAAAPDEARAAAAARIAAILEGDDFHQRIETRWLKARNPEPEDGESEWLDRLARWIESWLKDRDPRESGGSPFARGVAAVLWIAAAVLLVWLLYRLRKMPLPAVTAAASKEAPPRPEVLFGLDVRAEGLPADVPAAVEAEWRAGRARAALGLLYRATLARLVADHALPFADHHTEGECAVIVRRETPQLGNFFAELTRAWQGLAYAHRPPSDAELGRLCQHWREHFDHA